MITIISIASVITTDKIVTIIIIIVSIIISCIIRHARRAGRWGAHVALVLQLYDRGLAPRALFDYTCNSKFDHSMF